MTEAYTQQRDHKRDTPLAPVSQDLPFRIKHNSPPSVGNMSAFLHLHGVTQTLLLSVFTAIIGTAFHFGYAGSVINAPQDVIERFINDTYHKRHASEEKNGNGSSTESSAYISESAITLIFSLIVSVFALGGMIGGLCGGFITGRFGRLKILFSKGIVVLFSLQLTSKGGMLLNNIVSSLACILMFISKPVGSYELLIVGRFFIGVACGYGSSVAPMYISEVTPRHLRGTFGSVFQLGVVLMILLAQIVSLNAVLGSTSRWNYALGLPIVFSAAQVCLLLWVVPESPKYLLINKNDSIRTEEALRWLRGQSYNHHEVIEMQEEYSRQSGSAKILDLFRQRDLRWALLITIVVQLSQQLSGINAVTYYSVVIFQAANFSKTAAEYANLGLGALKVLVTIVSVFLMDRLGRRLLHLLGLGGMCISSVILVISLVIHAPGKALHIISLGATLLFVAFFGIGPGPIPWLITGELFGQSNRVAASSVATLVNWTGNFVVGLSFKPLFKDGLHEYTFLLFSGLLIIFFLFTFFFVPETRAKTVNTIYQEIAAGQVWRRSHQSVHSDNKVEPDNTANS